MLRFLVNLMFEATKKRCDDQNRLLTKTGADGTTTYTYDAAGNLIKEASPDGTVSYAYNAQNRLVQGETSDGQSSTYTYNALGARITNVQVRKNRNAGYANADLKDGSHGTDYLDFLKDGRFDWQRVFESEVGTVHQNDFETVTKHFIVDYLSVANRDIQVTEDGSWTARYVYDEAGTRISAEFDYAEGTRPGEGGENFQTDIAVNDIRKVWYRTSLLGSTLFAVDESGEVVSHTIYDPWGKPLTETYTDANFSGLDNANNFTGYTWDEVLGLYFAQNRFYDAADHRFTQEDIVKDGANWYIYCWNSPLNWVDMLGTKTDSAENVASNLGLLEGLAADYLGKKTSEKKESALVLQFLRRNAYTGNTWSSIAGAIDDNFVSYVKKTNLTVYNYFSVIACDKEFFVDGISPTIDGGVIDLWHFAATAGAQIYNSGFSDGFKPGVMPEYHLNNLAGWAGDLQTLLENNIVADLGQNPTYDEVYEKTQEYLTNVDPNSSHFSYVDLLSDVDSYNIAQSLKNSSSISVTFNDYYTSNYATRFTQFSNSLNKSSMRSLSLVYTNLKYMGAIKWPLYSDNLTKISSNVSKGTAYGYADYIWEQVKAEGKK